MRKILFFTAVVLLLPFVSAAQVEKRVEVTKTYVPSVGEAQKLPVVPDMTDTIRMQPDIDYSVTPTSLTTNLVTRPIRPATVTYWDFNRTAPYYIKIGAGYPANSVLDFYASTQNPDIGYVIGYINHDGRYAKIRNDAGYKINSTHMFNRIGVAAGRYLGKHILEGDISYENRLEHRSGYYSKVFHYYENVEFPDNISKVNYGEYKATIRFGDDFTDLSRTNFNVSVYATHFRNNSDMLPLLVFVPADDRGIQNDFGANAAIARSFNRHTLSAKISYDGKRTSDAWGNGAENIVSASLRYGYIGRVVNFEIGADYYYDCVRDYWITHSLIPVVKLRFDIGRSAICPFMDLSGRLSPNDFRSLLHENPYVYTDSALYIDDNVWHKSTVSYDFRIGIDGVVAKGRFAYRLYAGVSFVKNSNFWVYSESMDNMIEQARQDIYSINGEIDYKPVSGLTFMLGAHGYSYHQAILYSIGRPAFEGEFRAKYDMRKFSFGLGVDMQSVRYFSNIELSVDRLVMTVQLPFMANLRLNVDWRATKKIIVFAEGRNLANSRIYKWAYYPEYGPNFTLGIKANF